MLHKKQKMILQERVNIFFVNDHPKFKFILQSHKKRIIKVFVYQIVANFKFYLKFLLNSKVTHVNYAREIDMDINLHISS